MKITVTEIVLSLPSCHMVMMGFCMRKISSTNLNDCGPILLQTSVQLQQESQNCSSFRLVYFFFLVTDSLNGFISLTKACQGDRLDAGTTMLPRMTETDGPSDVSYKIPTHADFMIAYSTISGVIYYCREHYSSLPLLFSQDFIPGVIQLMDLGSFKHYAMFYRNEGEMKICFR